MNKNKSTHSSGAQVIGKIPANSTPEASSSGGIFSETFSGKLK